MTPDPAAPATGAVRLLRATVLGTASMALATAAHLVGGGGLPSAGVLTVVGLLVGLVAVTVTARRCRTVVLLGLLGVQQAVLHVVFAATAAATARCGGLAGPLLHHSALGSADPQLAGLAACGGAPGMTGSAMTGSAMLGPGWAMWAAHIAATVLTALLLARGEVWLWRVVDRVVTTASAAPGRRPASTRLRERQALPVAPLRARPYPVADPRGPPVLV